MNGGEQLGYFVLILWFLDSFNSCEQCPYLKPVLARRGSCVWWNKITSFQFTPDFPTWVWDQIFPGQKFIFVLTISQNVQLIRFLTWILYRTVPDWNTWRVFFVVLKRVITQLHGTSWNLKMPAYLEWVYSILVSKRFSCTFCKLVSRKINAEIENSRPFTWTSWLSKSVHLFTHYLPLSTFYPLIHY